MIEIQITGATVSRVEGFLPVTIWMSNGWMVQIESDIQIAASSTQTDRLSMDDDTVPEKLRTFLAGAEVTKLATTGGTLWIEVDRSSTLTVDPDPDFEAWNIVGPEGQRLICEAEGHLTSFAKET